LVVRYNRVSNAGKRRYRADGRGVRKHVSSAVEALIANTIGTRLQTMLLCGKMLKLVGSQEITRSAGGQRTMENIVAVISRSVLQAPSLSSERFTKIIDTLVPHIRDNFTRLRRISSTVEALIANTTGVRLQHRPLYVMVGSHEITRKLTVNSRHIFVVLIKRENSSA
jgi:hypothetical protein